MEHTTFSIPVRTGSRLEAEAVTSLYHALQALPDPRRKQGKRYWLAVLLCLVVLAKLAGEQTMSGVTEWVRHRGPDLAQRLGLRRAKMPCQTTSSHVLARVDGEYLDARLARLFRALLSPEPLWSRAQPIADPGRARRSSASGPRWQNPAGTHLPASSGSPTQLL